MNSRSRARSPPPTATSLGVPLLESGRSRSLFFSRDVRTLRELYPDNEEIQGLDDESRLVVSEPLGDLPGVWNEVPEASYGVIQPGQDEMHPFVPISDAVGAARAS